MLQPDSRRDDGAVEDRIANITMAKGRQAGDALRAVGTDKAEVDCGCRLQLCFKQLIWNVGKLPAIRPRRVQALADCFMERRATIPLLVDAGIGDRRSYERM